MRKPRMTVRLSPAQMQCLQELSTGLDTSLSLLVRSIISDFITRNEDTLNRIIDGKNKPITEEEEED